MKPKTPKPGELHVSLHGPNVREEDAIEVGEAMKNLLDAVAEAQGMKGLAWAVGDVRFICDGCGRDRPDEHDDWTNDGTDDFCPECSAKATK